MTYRPQHPLRSIQNLEFFNDLAVTGLTAGPAKSARNLKQTKYLVDLPPNFGRAGWTQLVGEKYEVCGGYLLNLPLRLHFQCSLGMGAGDGTNQRHRERRKWRRVARRRSN